MSEVNQSTRWFAIVPAAGSSRRMGQPKLLMKVGGQTVIERTLGSFRAVSLTGAAVVGRIGDHALREIIDQLDSAFDWVMGVEDPVDMLGSIRLGIAHLRTRYHPAARDWFFLLPADYPVIAGDVVTALMAASRTHQTLAIAPVYAGQRGHPLVLSWSLTDRLDDIPSGHGLNWLTREGGVAVTELPLNAPGILQDLDTPADFDAISRLTEPSGGAVERR